MIADSLNEVPITVEFRENGCGIYEPVKLLFIYSLLIGLPTSSTYETAALLVVSFVSFCCRLFRLGFFFLSLSSSKSILIFIEFLKVVV